MNYVYIKISIISKISSILGIFWWSTSFPSTRFNSIWWTVINPVNLSEHQIFIKRLLQTAAALSDQYENWVNQLRKLLFDDYRSRDWLTQFPSHSDSVVAHSKIESTKYGSCFFMITVPVIGWLNFPLTKIESTKHGSCFLMITDPVVGWLNFHHTHDDP